MKFLNYCLHLIRKLKILDKYPPEDTEVRLAEALATAPSIHFAEKFVDDWLRGHRKAPMPVDIYGATNAAHNLSKPSFSSFLVPLEPGEEPPGYKCDKCKDTGYVEVRAKAKPWDSKGEPYTGVRKCDCQVRA